MTAVEWMAERILKGYIVSIEQFEDLLEQAKEMEKQQIMDGYLKGYLEDIPKPSAMHYYEDMAEQYYNETFKSE